jgi:hypothetical protein
VIYSGAMKTNPLARRFVRIRGIMLCVALLGMVGMAFLAGQTLAQRVGYNTMVAQNQMPPAPAGSFADMMAAATR